MSTQICSKCSEEVENWWEEEGEFHCRDCNEQCDGCWDETNQCHLCEEEKDEEEYPEEGCCGRCGEDNNKGGSALWNDLCKECDDWEWGGAAEACKARMSAEEEDDDESEEEEE